MKKLQDLVKEIATNLGQTFFTPNFYLGLSIVLLTGIANPMLSICGIASIFFCRVGLNILRANYSHNLAGFTDVNAFYLGASIAYFFEWNFFLPITLAWASIALAFALVLCKRLLAPWQLSLLVLPFVGTFQVVWKLKDYLPLLKLKNFTAPSWDPLSRMDWGVFNLFKSVFHSMSQVLFQSSVTVGVLFLTVLLLVNRKLGLTIFAALIIASLVSYGASFPEFKVNSGLIGYNVALFVAALFVSSKQLKVMTTAFLVLSCVLLTHLIQELALSFGFIALSLPFVLCFWIYKLSVNRSEEEVGQQIISFDLYQERGRVNGW